MNQIPPPTQLKPSNTNKLLLICTNTGNIVFSYGDENLLQIKHQRLLHTNIFCLGFSQYSLLQMQQIYNVPLIEQSSQSCRTITGQIIRRKNMNKFSYKLWKSSRKQLLKCIQLNISMMKADFSSTIVQERTTEIMNLDSKQLDEDQQHIQREELVLVQVRETQSKGQFKTKLQDYDYTCSLIHKQKH